ncbi:MAG: hypothetical protein ACI3ZY_11005 [Parabacteroides sp.]
MNNVNFKAIVLLLSLLLSCTTENESPFEEKPIVLSSQRIPIKFKLDLAQEVLPFPQTKAMPSLDVGEPISKSDEEGGGTTPSDPVTPDVATDEYYQYLEYIVYTAGSDVPLKRTRFSLNDEETNGITASVVDSLLPGSYHFCFLAHSDAQVSFNEQTATFKKVGDTFHLYTTMDITEGSVVSQTYLLNRIIGRIEFVSTDKVAENLASFQISVENYPFSIDLATGIGRSSNSKYMQTDSFTDEQKGQNRQTHSFFSFQPTTSEQLIINLIAKDNEGNVTRVRENIQSTPEWNRIIRYTGVLYTPKVSDDTFNIEIEKEWNPEIEDTDIGK